MSRSNPHENGVSNPSTRWFEWNGEHGCVRYYDKDAKKNVDVGTDFTFILLDQLGGVKGWHEQSKSGIYSNEVKDTRQDVLIVKSFKGGILAEGLYKDIKDRVNSAGGHFAANCYLAYKNETGTLQIGCLRFKGAALRAWMDFSKAHRSELYEKGLRITGFTEGKNGRIIYRVPTIKVVELTQATNEVAVALDKELQTFLASYLKRNKREQVEAVAARVEDEQPPPLDEEYTPPVYEDDIPF